MERDQAGLARVHRVAAEAHAAAGRPGLVLFKWTCGGCGERVTFDVPDVVFLDAQHSQKADGTPCGFVTDLTRGGDLGYALVLPATTLAEVNDVLTAAFQRRDEVRSRRN